MHRCTGELWLQEHNGAHRYYAPLAKYFTVCITYRQTLVYTYIVKGIVIM